MNKQEFVEGRDFYFNEKGYMVLTELYLTARGYCCEMGCLHCPYNNPGKERELNKELNLFEKNLQNPDPKS